MRAEKIRTYNFPQNRITDHRINKKWHNLEAIMNGDLKPIMKSFQKNKNKHMPKGYPSLTQEQKQAIINRIKEKGERVADLPTHQKIWCGGLAKEYGVVPKTICNLLTRSTQSSGALLELSKLKRGTRGLAENHRSAN